MGRRGPQPGAGGRPKKPLADKIMEGNPGKRKLTVIGFEDTADLEALPARHRKDGAGQRRADEPDARC